MKYNFDDGGAGKKKPAPKKSAAVKKTTATAAVKPANTRRRRTQKRHPALKLILMSMVVAAFAAIFVGGYVFFSSAQYVLGSQIMQLEEYKFAQARTTIIYAYQDHANRKKPVEIARLHGEENRIWVPYANIPDNVKNAFVALEDKRYFDHSGVDWIRTVGSATKYKMSQGGSTITQQLIKNLTGEKEVTIVRKIREILIALNMERFYSKEEILETYLNTVYMGNGTYGLYTATEVYFGKPMKDLTIAEAAVLSVITNAPTTYDPLRNPENVKRRQMVALKAMLEQGYITQKQYDKAAKQKLVYTNSKGYKPSNSTSVTVTKGEVTSSFVDYVIEDVIKNLMAEYSYTRQYATQQLYYGGLKIYTTMDVKAQKAAEEVMLNKTGLNARDVSQGIQGAITMMDYEGRITAMVGQLGKKPSSRSLNRATTNRQPGSSIKPLSVYAPAVEKNLIHWSKLYNDSAFLTVNDKRWPPNYNGTLGSNKMVTVQYALAQSLNTVPARIVHNDLGVANAYDFATENLRLSNLNPAIDRASISAMALGGGNGGVNTVEMAAAYATFGNGGQYYKPHSYYKVTQEKDNEVTTLLTGGSEAQQAMKPETAELMRRMLYNIWRGSYTQNADTRRIKNMYMKSGTTNEHKDRWLAIGAPSHVFVAWYGFDQPKETSPRGTQNPGGVMIFNLLNKISGGLPAGDFKNTGNVVQRSYCTQTGNLAGKKCAKKSSGWYARTALPSTCNGSCAKEEKPEKTTERQMDGD